MAFRTGRGALEREDGHEGPTDATYPRDQTESRVGKNRRKRLNKEEKEHGDVATPDRGTGGLGRDLQDPIPVQTDPPYHPSYHPDAAAILGPEGVTKNANEGECFAVVTAVTKPYLFSRFDSLERWHDDVRSPIVEPEPEPEPEKATKKKKRKEVMSFCFGVCVLRLPCRRRCSPYSSFQRCAVSAVQKTGGRCEGGGGGGDHARMALVVRNDRPTGGDGGKPSEDDWPLCQGPSW